MGDISAKWNYRFQDESFYDPDNNDLTMIPQYRIWDARVAWTSAEDNWEVATWAKNLTDEEYRTHIFSQRGGEVAFAPHGAPATYGVSLTYTY